MWARNPLAGMVMGGVLMGAAPVHAESCGPLDATQALVARLGGGELIKATEAQSEFLSDAASVYGGETRLASLNDGGVSAVYVANGEACGLVLFGPEGAKIIAAIGKDRTAHVGAAL